jgi:hypothetical protein
MKRIGLVSAALLFIAAQAQAINWVMPTVMNSPTQCGNWLICMLNAWLQ